MAVAKKAAAKKAAVKKKPEAKKAAAKPAKETKPAKEAKAAAPAAAPAAPTIYDHLTAAAKVTPNAGEDYQAFAVRLMEGINALPQEEFDKLPEDAQAWFNSQAEAYSGEKPIAVLAGCPKPAKAEKKAAKPAAKKDKPAKAAKPPKPVRDAAKIRAESTAGKIHALVVAKPDIDFTAVAKKLGIEDTPGSYAWNRFNEARNLMRLVEARAAAA